MVKKTNNYIVILCGGTGPRLWPLSRVDHPKQFLKIFSSNSILKETFLRSKKIVPSKNIFIVTNYKYLDLIKQNLKGLVLPQNILCEPEKKNTAMAILYACAVISQKNPEAIIASFPSDHFISRLDKFTKDIKKSFLLAQKNTIVTIGIKPNSPSTSFGYIQVNPQNHVTNFIEKPNLSSAIKLIQKNNCYWNSGIYVFKPSTLLTEFNLYAKEYIPLYNKLQENYQQEKIVKKIFSLSPSLAIDYAVSEKSKNIQLIPATFGWSDIGEWKSIYEKLPKTGNNIATISKNDKFVEVNSEKCLVSSTVPNKLIGLVDVSNLAVVDTPDALLICNIAKDGSFHVRDLITKIVQNIKLKHYFTGKND